LLSNEKIFIDLGSLLYIKLCYHLSRLMLKFNYKKLIFQGEK